MTPPPRKPLPLAVKLAVALRELGVTEAEIDWSHEPALALRAIRTDGRDYDPPQHAPAYIRIRKRADHDRITYKDNGTGRGDLTAIAHVRRLERKRQEHLTAMQRKLGMSAPAAPKKKWRWPKQSFPKRRR